MDSEILARRDAGDLAGAATLALRAYGPEIMGLLRALHREPADADDVFAEFAKDLWQGLATFAGRSSVRTWAYVVARHASARGRRQRRDREVHDSAAIEEAVAQVRTETQTFLRSETKDKVARLRELLAPEERLLLVLRVDRDFDWLEIARIMSEEDEPKRAAARLRQRFQAIKEKLRRAVREDT